jgi:SHS2 domain-containing protein
LTAIEWLDHTADAGFRATGDSIEEAFCEAARACFSLMFAVDEIRPQTEHRVAVSASSLSELLVEWLSGLLAQKDLSGLVFSRFEVTIAGDDQRGFTATGRGFGETLDRDRHQPGTEIKGISYLGLDVSRRGEMWVVQVVVDV